MTNIRIISGMNIKIKYKNDNKIYIFDSFEKISNYDNVLSMECEWNLLTSLSKLPNSLKKLN
jgi:hypothetical protein